MSMHPIVHLVLLGDGRRPWPLGKVWNVEKSPQAISDLLHQQSFSTDAEAWLFWDNELGNPNPDTVLAALSLPGDVLHAGLRLGMCGLPGLIQFVKPTWMLNCDPDPNREATSWRLSLRACLIRASVLSGMACVDPNFQSLDGASLEMGHRYVTNGIILRHVPCLLPSEFFTASTSIPFADECRFIFYRMGRKWLFWSLVRALLTGYSRIGEVIGAFRELSKMTLPAKIQPFCRLIPGLMTDPGTYRVSVLIPSLERYEYLRKLLPQLGQQTVRPIEVIVVDQTPVSKRLPTFFEENADLPLKILYLDRPGQCSARNEGLRIAKGDYILFLDDDDEIPSDLIEAHLRSLVHHQASVSCGVDASDCKLKAREPTQEVRCSHNFPTNNTLVCRRVIEETGLFDTTYDCLNAEDLDLGMRSYLNGNLLVLNQAIQVIHHRAPTGGLRTHGVGVVGSLLSCRLPSVTDIYFWKRYFTPAQVRERLWIVLFRTFSFHGNLAGKILHFILAIFLFPDALWRIGKNHRSADQMLKEFSRIPNLDERETITDAPLVSVLMPVYNREKLVGDAIRSIQSQTLLDWELIILDDASNDGTLEVCRKFESEDKRIRVLQNERNLGVGESRNRLMKYATGRYIAIHDSDDVSVPERLAWEVEILETKPEVGIVSGVVAWRDFDDGRVLWHFPPSLHAGKQYTQEIRKMVKIEYLTGDVPNAACMFRRSLVDHLSEPYAKYRVNEDWYFFIHLVHRTRTWGIPKILVHMNRGKNHTHLLSHYVWSLREAQLLKRDLYEYYKNRSDSPINYYLFRRSTARLVHWEGLYIGGWKGRLTNVRALIWDPFYLDAWKSLWASCRRALAKGWRFTSGSLKRTAVLSESGE